MRPPARALTAVAVALTLSWVAAACGSSGSSEESAAGTSTTTTTQAPTAEQLQGALLTPTDLPGYSQYAPEGVTETESGTEAGGCPGPGIDPIQKVKAGFYTDGSIRQVVEFIFVNPPGSADAAVEWLEAAARCPPHEETVAGITYTVTPEGAAPAPDVGDGITAQSVSYTGGFVGNRIVYDVFCGDLRVSVQVTQLGGPVDQAAAEQTLRTALERVDAGLGREACKVPAT